MMNKPVHPVAILCDYVLAISQKGLSRIVHEHAPNSPNPALSLEAPGVGTVRAWLAMQTACDLVDERAGGMP